MAIELESSGVSPRISFSHDFCQAEGVPLEQHPRRSNSIGIDFDFCVRKSFEADSSSADELFSDGKILPTEVKKTNNNIPVKQSGHPVDQSSPQALAPLPPIMPAFNCEHTAASSKNYVEESKGESLSSKGSKIMRDEAGDDDHLDEKQSSKSFWRFKRSSSLNCGSGYGRSLCPIPPLLSRSNSTGSASNDKRAALSKDKENSHKQASIRSSNSSASSSSSTNHLKPPLKKSYGSYGNGTIHVTPVLNVPSGNLFGLGSKLFNGKDKNKLKK